MTATAEFRPRKRENAKDVKDMNLNPLRLSTCRAFAFSRSEQAFVSEAGHV
jgi:hypothetical protein